VFAISCVDVVQGQNSYIAPFPSSASVSNCHVFCAPNLLPLQRWKVRFLCHVWKVHCPGCVELLKSLLDSPNLVFCSIFISFHYHQASKHICINLSSSLLSRFTLLASNSSTHRSLYQLYHFSRTTSIRMQCGLTTIAAGLACFAHVSAVPATISSVVYPTTGNFYLKTNGTAEFDALYATPYHTGLSSDAHVL